MYLKAEAPILVNALACEKLILLKFVHPSNALAPILTKVSGKLTAGISLQFLNVLLPICSSCEGKVNDAIDSQFSNALLLIVARSSDKISSSK